MYSKYKCVHIYIKICIYIYIYIHILASGIFLRLCGEEGVAEPVTRDCPTL